MTRRAVAALLLLAAVVAGAGCSTGDEPAARAPRAPSGPPATGGTEEAVAGGAVELSGTPGDLTTDVAATTRSLREYWTQQLPATYDRTFTPLAGGFQPKDESSPPWTCGGRRTSYDDVRGNAFYCPADDYIAFDAASLLPTLDEEHGSLTPAVVLAHEMGHAVQARAGVEAPSVVRELQADCFAGSWVAFAQQSEADPVAVAESGLDASVRALPTLRDRPGTAATDPQAHGLAFDRINAYQTGYEQGADRCATYPRGGVAVSELPFRTVTEAATGGDLPFARTVQVTVQSLEMFWPAALPRLAPDATWEDPRPVPVAGTPLPACPGDEGYDAEAVSSWCATDDAVTWADDALAQLHARVGDVAAAAVLSLSWARAGQARAGLADTGTDAELQQVCLTGAWVAAFGGQGGEAGVELSPGDIDEALLAVLSPLAPDQAGAVLDTSFERADALRTGLLQGLGGC